MLMRCWRSVAVCLLWSTMSAGIHAQTNKTAPAASERFPYAFSNFVWWSDADLRSELKHRIPGLRDDLARSSAMESQVRTALIALLQQKGIHAEVQSIEPSQNVFSYQRVPDAPPPSIVFSVMEPPEIAIEKLVLDNPPPAAGEILRETAKDLQGKPYDATSFWYQESRIAASLQGIGYLSVTVAFESGTPAKQGERYLVPLTAVINAGPQYRVATVSGDGGPLLHGRDLSSYFSLKAGDVATPNAFGRLEGSLRTVYTHEGYADVDFHGDPVLDKEHALASYHLVVIPGPQYHLRTLTIKGLTAEQELLVRGLFGGKPGDIYDQAAINDLYQKLPSSADLKDKSFSFSPKQDKSLGVTDLTLAFFKN